MQSPSASGQRVAMAFAALAMGVCSGLGAGVTLVTHGYNGNVTEWVIPMVNKMAQHRPFPGTNVSVYQVSITRPSSSYSVTASFLDGVAPLASDSGEILIALDWSTLSSGSVNTIAIATQLAAALQATNLLADLGGRALCELPLHLVGHSRGASVIAETARLLGAQGIWVDHLTTLDPYPVSLFGDPAMKLYANVVFADNYWQNTDFPQGQSLSGAYNRYLSALGTGGYSPGSAHSDTHLWYHGTADLATPTSDNLATLGATERANWYTAFEAGGTNTGFAWSLAGEGNRLSTNQPAGAGTDSVVAGLNKNWNLGASGAANRVSLTSNSGLWPNLLRFGLAGTNVVGAGQPLPVFLYHQSGSNALVSLDLRIFLDPDANPYNGIGPTVYQTNLLTTGTNSVGAFSYGIPTQQALTPGVYNVGASLSDGRSTRYLYATQRLMIAPSLAPPTMLATRTPAGSPSFFVSGLPGQRVVVYASSGWEPWQPIQTNLLSGPAAPISDPAGTGSTSRYYRAALVP